MTPAEKMAQEVENLTPFTDGDSVVRDEAAAMIRRLAAALIEFREAYENGGFVKHGIMERHAEALRDVREEA